MAGPERADARPRLTRVRTIHRRLPRFCRLAIAGAFVVTAAATAGCASRDDVKTSCGGDSVYLESDGSREGLLNCAGVAVAQPVTIHVGETATVRMVKATPPGIASSNSIVLTTRGALIRGVATGVADVRIQASTLCGSDVVVTCTLMRVTVVP